MGRARLTFLLALTILAATPAAAEDVPGYKPTYAIVRARFVPKEALPALGGPDTYVGVHVRGEVQVTTVLAGKLDRKALTSELWLPKMEGPLDVYLLLETQWENDIEIAGWSRVQNGFCIEPQQALDTEPGDILRLRQQYPCKR